MHMDALLQDRYKMLTVNKSDVNVSLKLHAEEIESREVIYVVSAK